MTRKALILPTVVRAQGDEPEITITTGGPDREGDIIEPDGAELSDYLKNPTVGYWHFRPGDAALPVGSTVSLTVEPGRGLRAKWKWLEGDPFATRVRNAWEQGVLRAASVGFLPLASEPRRDVRGLRFTRWTLLEWSLVPVPANPEAVRVLRSLGLPAEAADESDVVQIVFRDEAADGDDGDPILNIRRSELVATIRASVAPLVEQARLLTAQLAAPEPDVLQADLEPGELDEIIVDALRHELAAVVAREVKAAINALRGRID